MMENSAENTRDFCCICEANGTQIVMIFMMKYDFFLRFPFASHSEYRFEGLFGSKIA